MGRTAKPFPSEVPMSLPYANRLDPTTSFYHDPTSSIDQSASGNGLAGTHATDDNTVQEPTSSSPNIGNADSLDQKPSPKGSGDRFGSDKVPKMEQIYLSGGVIVYAEASADLRWGERNGYPFLISKQQLCGSALSAINDSERDYDISAWCSKLQEPSDDFAFSVLPLYLLNGHKCPDCPSVSSILAVMGKWWHKHQADPTPQFRRYTLVLISQFYNTSIRVGGESGSVELTLRGVEVEGDSLALLCEDQNDTTVEVEVRCEGFSLGASGVILPHSVHDFARNMLCPLPPKPRQTSRILRKPHQIQFATANHRVTVAVCPSLSSPSYEWEWAKHELENRLSYQHEIGTPKEIKTLFDDIRRRLKWTYRCTPERLMWGAVTSINFIQSPKLRMAMTEAHGKLSWITSTAPRPVRDAICLHNIFINPPALGEDDYEELIRELQQNEGDLISLVQGFWSTLQKPETDTALANGARRFETFMLYVLALLQHFPVRSSQVAGGMERQHFTITLTVSGVCLLFREASVTLEWLELEAAFQSENIPSLLGLQFDTLPEIFAQMPPFQGLCERHSSLRHDRCFLGSIQSDADLSLLCKGFNNLTTSDYLEPPPQGNYVLVRPSRKYDVSRNWIFQQYNHPFTQYICLDDHGRTESTIVTAECDMAFQRFYFKAVIKDKTCRSTPCRDKMILQHFQDPFPYLLPPLGQLVEDLDLMLAYTGPYPEKLERPLHKYFNLMEKFLAREEVLDNIAGTHLHLHCQQIQLCCNFISNLFWCDYSRLRPLLFELKQRVEATMHSCVQSLSFGFTLEQHTAHESTASESTADDSTASEPMASESTASESTANESMVSGSTVCEPTDDGEGLSPILNEGVMDSNSVSQCNEAPTVNDITPIPCIFGPTATIVKGFNTCSVKSHNEIDWKVHDLYNHQQPDQWICPEETCRVSFFHTSTSLKDHLREHGRTGDVTEEVKQWYAPSNYQRAFFCPHCDKVIRHGFVDLEAVEARYQHILQHLRPQELDEDAVWVENNDLVWVESASSQTYDGMEMEMEVVSMN